MTKTIDRGDSVLQELVTVAQALTGAISEVRLAVLQLSDRVEGAQHVTSYIHQADVFLARAQGAWERLTEAEGEPSPEGPQGVFAAFGVHRVDENGKCDCGEYCRAVMDWNRNDVRRKAGL